MVKGNQKIYGVKTPELNLLAKEYKSGSFELAEELWKAGALEERIIAIKIMEKTGKQEPARLLRLFKKCAADIDNWAVCDGLGMQFLRGIVKTHANEIFALAKKLNRFTQLLAEKVITGHGRMVHAERVFQIRDHGIGESFGEG